MPKKIIAVLVLISFTIVSFPLLAAEMMPARQDEIALELSAEDWVQTQTAEVVITVNATMRQQEAAAARRKILATLDNLAPDTSWRIVTFNRSADQSGLDSWFVEARGRVADAALDGLRQAAEKASEPGLQITVGAINFTPTLAEMEAIRMRLRQDIYRRAQEELDQARQAFPDKDYRIGRIDFTGIRPAVTDSRFGARLAVAEAADQGVAVEGRVRMTATVILAAAPPESE